MRNNAESLLEIVDRFENSSLKESANIATALLNQMKADIESRGTTMGDIITTSIVTHFLWKILLSSEVELSLGKSNKELTPDAKRQFLSEIFPQDWLIEQKIGFDDQEVWDIVWGDDEPDPVYICARIEVGKIRTGGMKVWTALNLDEDKGPVCVRFDSVINDGALMPEIKKLMLSSTTTEQESVIRISQLNQGFGKAVIALGAHPLEVHRALQGNLKDGFNKVEKSPYKLRGEPGHDPTLSKIIKRFHYEFQQLHAFFSHPTTRHAFTLALDHQRPNF